MSSLARVDRSFTTISILFNVHDQLLWRYILERAIAHVPSPYTCSDSVSPAGEVGTAAEDSAAADSAAWAGTGTERLRGCVRAGVVLSENRVAHVLMPAAGR